MVRAGKDPLKAKREAERHTHLRRGYLQSLRVEQAHMEQCQACSAIYKYATDIRIPQNWSVENIRYYHGDVMAVLTPFWTVKPETARRVRQRIGTVMKWAVAQGYRDYDPAQNVIEALPKQNKVQNHRKALHYSEVAGCIDAIKRSKAGDATKLALEFLILTASRSGEIRNARWDEISLSISPSSPLPVWSVPAARMKAKRSILFLYQ